MRFFSALITCTIMFAVTLLPANADDIKVKDAYATTAKDTWQIGTDKIGLTYQLKNGNFQITSLKNKTNNVSYITADAPAAVFENMAPILSDFEPELLWSIGVPQNASVDPVNDNLQVNVKKGDRIAFSIGANGNLVDDQMEWIITIKYADGTTYKSDSDPKLLDNEIWSFYAKDVKENILVPLSVTTWSESSNENLRIISTMEPHIGATVMHPSNEYDAVRVFTAPKDGVISISGIAKHLDDGDVTASIYKLLPPRSGVRSTRNFKLERAQASQTVFGGKPAARLDITLLEGDLRLRYHVIAFPDTAIVRHWFDFENISTKTINLKDKGIMLSLSLNAPADTFTNNWIIGAMRFEDQGNLYTENISENYTRNLLGSMTFDYVPWIALVRKNTPNDGLFAAPDYLGRWRITTRKNQNKPIGITMEMIDIEQVTLNPGDSYKMPYVVIGVMPNKLDSMAQDLYNWQYRYMWDYTHEDWYAKMPFTVAWYGESDNVQQQFAGHLADLDMNWTEYIRQVGMEILWEDAGWPATRVWYAPNMEGPDFSQTRRYLDKNDMKLCVWMLDQQHPGVISSKVAAWGNFQRRTDNYYFDANVDPMFREHTEKFLKEHQRSSFHTCSMGSTYAHTFEVQRYTDINYDSDGPGSDFTNTYWSYLDTPDKWFDNLNMWGEYRDERGFRYLTQVPKWGIYLEKEDTHKLRHLCDLYHYMLDCGVAGRWSYIVHPKIEGDTEEYYCQRISYDKKKSMIIFKHLSTGTVKIYPADLIPEENYYMEYEQLAEKVTRTGTDLMTNGITITDQLAGELIFLNMPDRPGSGRDKTNPTPPSNAYTKRETNVGFTGIGVYFTPGMDNNWISYYEVRRGDEILDVVATGHYYFDRSASWNAADYYVRTVDGDGNVSAWRKATPVANEALIYSALGGLYSENGRMGWSAETSTDGITFEETTWIPPAARPGIDAGGTTIQRGGAEGYWEGAETARVGRGWQQASETAMISRTWTAPQSGSVRVTGKAVKELYNIDDGAPVGVKITLNNQEVWSDTVKLSDKKGVSHDLSFDINAGDKIRFVLERGTSPKHDIIVWMPNIVYEDTAQKQNESIVRILCGSPVNYTDNTGIIWSKDSFYKGGKTFKSDAKMEIGLNKTDDSNLYKYGRTGSDFLYSIPVEKGIYCIRLKFAETKYEYFFQRPFDVFVNNKRVLTNFDIAQAARGPRRPYDRLVRYVVPNEAGDIVIRFTSGWEPDKATEEAIIQAIEITPEQKNIVRINVGSEENFVDWNSFVWQGDAYYSGGKNITGYNTGNPTKVTPWPTLHHTTVLPGDENIEHASPTFYDQDLYRSAKSGREITYKIPVPDRLYSIQLKFAELWLKEAGKRPMDIEINGKLIFKDFDPATQAGKTHMSADLRIDDIIPNKSGEIVVKIRATGENDAILQGILIE